MFNGRYGVDKFNKTMVFLALGISIVNIFLPYGTFKTLLSVVSTALIVYTVFRMFSRDFIKRGKELQKYMEVETAFKQWTWRIKANLKKLSIESIKERRKYKYYSCPRCLQRLRVPKGKGKIRITCSKCGNKFEAKS
ncbi:MAG: hypothetical protein IJO48_00810 [Clostridia bacterium]|nr:hypothetical protein [Clostridia bacterium]